MTKGLDYPGVTIVFFCHDGKGNYLFNKRSQNCRDEHGVWDSGGGGLDFGDKVEDRLKTELLEEYGVKPLGIEFLGYRDIHRNQQDKETHWLALDFRIQVDPSKVINGEPHKFDEICWFRLDNLPEQVHSQLPAALEKNIDKLK